MSGVIKLDKTAVDEALNKIQRMIEVSEDDLKAFEKVANELLTDQNTASSKRLRKIKETHVEKAQERKLAIEQAVANLKTAHAALTKYAEAFEM